MNANFHDFLKYESIKKKIKFIEAKIARLEHVS